MSAARPIVGCLLAVLTVICYVPRGWTQQPSPATAQPTTPPDATEPQTDEPDRTSIEDLLQLDIEELGQIDVRPSQPAEQPSVPSTLLDTLELAEEVDATTGGLLDQAPSINVRRTSAINLDPQVRGYHSRQIRAEADGVPQLKTRIDIDSLFSQIDPGLVQEVSIVEGPYSSLYGPGFAFISANLLSPRRYQRPEFHGRSTFQQETNGRGLYWRDSVWGGDQDWSFIASYGQRVGNDYKPGSDSFEFRVPASYNKWDAFLSTSLDLTDLSRVEFSYLRTEQNNVELPGVVYDINNSHSDQFNIRYVLQDDRDSPERFVAQYWWGRTRYYGDSLRESKQRTYFPRFVTDNFLGLQPPLDVFNVASVLVDGALQSTGAKAYAQFGETDGPLLTVGGDWRRYQQRHFEPTLNGLGQNAIIVGQNPIFIPGINEGTPDFRGIPKSSLDDLGAFANLRIPVLEERLTASMGGRIDFTTPFVDLQDVIVTDPSLLTEPSRTLGMGYGTMQWRLSDAVAVDGGVGFGMRNASLGELYSDVPSSPVIRFTGPIAGDSDLNPEKSLQFDLGVAHQTQRWRFAVRGHHATIHDYILPIPLIAFGPSDPQFTLGRSIDLAGGTVPVADSGLIGYQYANVDRATLWGGEITLDYKLNDWTTIDGSVAYVKGTNHTPKVAAVLDDGTVAFAPSPKGAEGLPGIYPLASTVALRITEPCHQWWSLSFTVRMVNGQNFVADGLGEVGTPGFTTFGLRGFVQLTENVRLRSSIENLLDRAYTEHSSLGILNPAGAVSFVKEPGINWLVGIEAEF